MGFSESDGPNWHPIISGSGNYRPQYDRKGLMGIDWILKYYISTAIRRVKERRSSQWPVVDGTVYASEALGLRAKVVYTYFADERYTGEHTRLFWLADSAEAYAALFELMRKLPVRYKVGQAEKSIVRSQDLGRRATELDGV